MSPKASFSVLRSRRGIVLSDEQARIRAVAVPR